MSHDTFRSGGAPVPATFDPPGPSSPSVHLNLNVRGAAPSATLQVNEMCDTLEREGREVFRLGLGQSPFPVPEPVVQALRDNAGRKEYLPVRGLEALREAVAAYHRRRTGTARLAENVLIGPGSKELMFLLQMVYYGDLVIPTPSWVSYAPQARIIGRHVRWIDTASANDWKLQPDDLEKLCANDPGRPRIVVLNYPNNPTGHTYSDRELQHLGEVARRYRVIVLSDEIYGEIHHQGAHVSIARYYPEGTIISTGLSKWCGAGGWRLGTFTCPRHLGWLLGSDGSRRQRDLHVNERAHPVRGGDRVRGRSVHRPVPARLTPGARGAGAALRGRPARRRAAAAGAGGRVLYIPGLPAVQGATARPAACAPAARSAGRCCRIPAWRPYLERASGGHRKNSRCAWRTSTSTAARRWMRLRHSAKRRALHDAFLRTRCPRVTEAMDRVADWLRALGDIDERPDEQEMKEVS